jgi:hypothetical protein
MKLWKATLILGSVLLLFAGPAFAQCEYDSAPNCGDDAFYDPSNNFYGPQNNLYPPSAVTYSLPRGGSGQQSESMGVAVNDGNYVPSEFMDYDQAVALGNLQLHEMNEHQGSVKPSFAEAARQARAAGAPDRKATVFVQQDGNGNLQVCDPQDYQCEPL